jgi:hypothetical protein
MALPEVIATKINTSAVDSGTHKGYSHGQWVVHIVAEAPWFLFQPSLLHNQKTTFGSAAAFRCAQPLAQLRPGEYPRFDEEEHRHQPEY